MRTIGNMNVPAENAYGRLRKHEYTIREKSMTFDSMEALNAYQAENTDAYVYHMSVLNGVISVQMRYIEEVKTDV